MKRRGTKLLFILAILLIASLSLLTNNSFAITITGPDQIATGSSTQYAVSGCNGTVTWNAAGTGASINQSGTINTEATACGAITITARCSDGTTATKEIRSSGSGAGQWVLKESCGTPVNYIASKTEGKYSYTNWWCSAYVNSWYQCLGERCTCCYLCTGCPAYVHTPEQEQGIWNDCCPEASSLSEWQCLPCTNGQSWSCYSGASETKGIGICKEGTQTCTNEQWGTCEGEITPQPEICGDKIDNDCDKVVDNNCENLILTLNPSEIYPNETGSPVSSVVIAKLVDNDGNPLSGYQVNFQSEIIESKGHTHTNTRSPGTIEESCVTDDEGKCPVNYSSSLVAGKDKITAYLSDYPDVKDSKEITVKVPGLIPLYEYVFYYLTGNARPGPGDRHPDNHYGTPGTNDKVANVAWDYFNGTNAMLGINDMSLEWGGLFDIDGNWMPPHETHKVGRSVDIDRNAKSSETLKYVAVDKIRLNKIAVYYGGIRAKESTIHYDFY